MADMAQIPQFVKPHVADQVIAGDDADQRNRGAAIVAWQLDNSAVFARCFWIATILAGGMALWFRSWLPVAVALPLLGAIYFRLIVSMTRSVAREGVLPEYQAAYKRLYYRDIAFKKQVDDLLAGTAKKGKG